MSQNPLLLWGLSESSACLLTTVQVVPVKRQLRDAAEQMRVKLAPHSLTSFDLALAQSKLVTLVEKDEEYMISRVWY